MIPRDQTSEKHIIFHFSRDLSTARSLRMDSPLGATTSRSSPWAWTVTQATGWGPRGAMEAMKDGSRVKCPIFIQRYGRYDQLSEGCLQISGSVWSLKIVK